MTMLQIEAELYMLINTDDQESAHIEADKLLIAALRQCWASAGQDDVETVIKAFEAVRKWYS